MRDGRLRDPFCRGWPVLDGSDNRQRLCWHCPRESPASPLPVSKTTDSFFRLTRSSSWSSAVSGPSFTPSLSCLIIFIRQNYPLPSFEVSAQTYTDHHIVGFLKIDKETSKNRTCHFLLQLMHGHRHLVRQLLNLFPTLPIFPRVQRNLIQSLATVTRLHQCFSRSVSRLASSTERSQCQFASFFGSTFPKPRGKLASLLLANVAVQNLTLRSRSTAEIDELYERKIQAWRWSKTATAAEGQMHAVAQIKGRV